MAVGFLWDCEHPGYGLHISASQVFKPLPHHRSTCARPAQQTLSETHLNQLVDAEVGQLQRLNGA